MVAMGRDTGDIVVWGDGLNAWGHLNNASAFEDGKIEEARGFAVSRRRRLVILNTLAKSLILLRRTSAPWRFASPARYERPAVFHTGRLGHSVPADSGPHRRRALTVTRLRDVGGALPNTKRKRQL